MRHFVLNLVLKVEPPTTFNKQNADRLVITLERILKGKIMML